MATYRLAKKAVHQSLDQIWIEGFSVFIYDIVLAALFQLSNSHVEHHLLKGNLNLCVMKNIKIIIQMIKLIIFYEFKFFR